MLPIQGGFFAQSSVFVPLSRPGQKGDISVTILRSTWYHRPKVSLAFGPELGLHPTSVSDSDGNPEAHLSKCMCNGLHLALIMTIGGCLRHWDSACPQVLCVLWGTRG